MSPVLTQLFGLLKPPEFQPYVCAVFSKVLNQKHMLIVKKKKSTIVPFHAYLSIRNVLSISFQILPISEDKTGILIPVN